MMDRDSVKELVREVIGPNTPMEDTGNWVSLPCVFAHWKHEKRKDERPSAGISVKDGDTSIYNCFTCHSKGPLGWMLKELSRYTGEDYSGLIDEVEDDEFLGGHVPEWGTRQVDEVPEPIDKDFHFDLYDTAVGHWYLKHRGISEAAARSMELLLDPADSQGAERIMFPVYGYDKKLYGFSGRAVDSRVALKVRDYHGLPKRHLLLGAQLVLPDDEFVVVVEGLVDTARMVSFGLPGLGFMSSTLTEYQAEILKDIGKPVYFFHDNDKAGIDARDKARELLWRHVPVMKVRYPTERTVETPEGDLRPPEDPAELTKDQALEMIDDARLA